MSKEKETGPIATTQQSSLSGVDVAQVEHANFDGTDGEDKITTDVSGKNTPPTLVRSVLFSDKVIDVILDAIIETYQQGGDNVINDFVDRFNSFGFTSGYRQVPLQFGAYPETGFSEAILKVRTKLDTMTFDELEGVMNSLAEGLRESLIVLASTLTSTATRTGDSYSGFVDRSHVYKAFGKRADLTHFDSRLIDPQLVHLWLIAPASGGKSTAVRKVLDDETGVIIRYGEPYQAEFDDESNVIHVSSMHAMITMSSFLTFVGLDHAIDSGRLWYSSLTGAAVTKGLKDDLPLAITNWNNAAASLGSGTAIITLNPAFGSDDPNDQTSSDLIRAIYQVARGSAGGAIRLENYQVRDMDVRTRDQGRLIIEHNKTQKPTSTAVEESESVTDLPARTEANVSELGNDYASVAEHDRMEGSDVEQVVATSDDIASIFAIPKKTLS